ncbi:hypothetical protein UA08_07355 [Talaromyces atroroseus]|uniref:Peptidase M20 domain-containing protein 2 n=1 Tax=Talaromyces atroroseus TaxID=1441469 RepID=A0A225AA91_TALAT|nr:hypothetical protein UA08_07355 [Talaromyces atroroseus]OKL57040.1 hypothetical protein UA08_07355 [Talaromyces atroroseus]
MPLSAIDLEQARVLVNDRINEANPDLHKINKALHSHPELAYKEYFAHETLTTYLESLGFVVKRSTYGLETSFEASLGQGGRQVVFCAEYDALPEIGHACGHNLIATASLAAFIGAAHAMVTLSIPGRLRLLGTPAEEGGGGKAKLIDAGAFNPPEDIAAAIMAHPKALYLIQQDGDGLSGLAGIRLAASHKFRVEFHGKTAHAGNSPWKGTNALDAAVAAYHNVALLRQQIQPDERIHCIIEVGGTAQNIIPDYSRLSWNVRGPSMTTADALLKRVKACIEAGATATGCKLNYIPVYVEDMATLGQKILFKRPKGGSGSTDMGNVSHHVPSFHGYFAVPTEKDVGAHNPKFTAAAGRDEAHVSAIESAKGMAMLALRVLVDDTIAKEALLDFESLDE